jgi:hypothetical protein
MIPGTVARWTMHIGEKDGPIFKANIHTSANHRWKRHEVQGKGVHLVTTRPLSSRISGLEGYATKRNLGIFWHWSFDRQETRDTAFPSVGLLSRNRLFEANPADPLPSSLLRMSRIPAMILCCVICDNTEQATGSLNSGYSSPSPTQRGAPSQTPLTP